MATPKRPPGRPRNPRRDAAMRDYVKLKRGREWFVEGKIVLYPNGRFGGYAPLPSDYRYTLAALAAKHRVTMPQLSKWARLLGVQRQRRTNG